ncbi:MAG: DUF3791 domain-containing protein [Lachnospiraceae bacterium]|nr:DUF3791 domain-containing protein [Lachnospiraceae bacterium]
MDKEKCSFVIYMIHACANTWNLRPTEVYSLLEMSGCIDKFLVPDFDILHTQSTVYVVEDIKKYLEVRGWKV